MAASDRVHVRLAELVAALLVNIGCHTDAHEQAKWFGDDFALKALKYEHQMPSLGAVAATRRELMQSAGAVEGGDRA